MTRNGIDRPDLFHYFDPKWKKIGMITNHSGTTRDLTPSRKIIHEKLGLELLFSPEHGIFGAEQAGAAVVGVKDPVTGVPCLSVYGEDNALNGETVGSLDAVVYDIQDVGSRFYTYLYAMTDAMALCAKAGVRFVVLDRVNPVNGRNTEGILLEEDCSSGVGRFRIPARYGLTIGEFALLANDRFGIGCDLTVVPCTGWGRDAEFESTGLSWVNPSPNIPSPDCARVYCGTCVFEGTNVSEGRGTTHPFEMVGAPFLDAEKCLKRLEKYHLPGALFRECRFVPVFEKYKGELCRGIQIHVTDRKAFNGFETGFRLWQAIRGETPEFRFRTDPADETAATHFDFLLGTKSVRLGKADPDGFVTRAREESADFRAGIGKWLLY